MWTRSCGVCIELLKKLRLCDSSFFLPTRLACREATVEDSVQPMDGPGMTAHWILEISQDGTRRLVRHWFKNETVGVLYLLRLICRSEGENRARALLLRGTQTLPISLQSLHRARLNATGRVEVHANFHTNGRQDAMLEDFIGRISQEPAITAVSWHVLRQAEQ